MPRVAGNTPLNTLVAGIDGAAARAVQSRLSSLLVEAAVCCQYHQQPEHRMMSTSMWSRIMGWLARVDEAGEIVSDRRQLTERYDDVD